MSESADEVFTRRLVAARAGSASAMGELMESVRPRLRAFLRQSVGSALRRHVSISDLEQEVLLGAQGLVDRMNEDARPSDLHALVLRHAHWAIGKAARSSREIRGESVLGASQLDPATPVPTMGDVTAADEFDRVQQVLEGMPEDLRVVVRLRQQDLTFEQIGASLGLGPDAARKRFLRAARLLRERLDS